MKSIFLLAALLTIPTLVLSHGGGLNAEGCHNNRKTGDYHCHRAKAPEKSVAAPERTNPPATPGAPVCHTGPRGGRYTITPSGRKNYKGC